MSAVVLYAKFPTQTEFCRFGRASLPSEISPGFFFSFFGLDEVDGPETSAGTAPPEFNLRFFCRRLSACERTGSSGSSVTVSASRAEESSASDPESESESESEPDAEDVECEANEGDDDDEESDSTASLEISANLRFGFPDAEGFLRRDMME